MNIDHFGRPTTIGALSPGALFRCAPDETELLGMKVWTPGRATRLTFRAGDKAPDVNRGTEDPNQAVVELTRARLRPLLSDLNMCWNAPADLGDLMFFDERLVLYSCIGSQHVFINRETGEVTNAQRWSAVIRCWTIVDVIDAQTATLIFEWRGHAGEGHPAHG